jgi:nucleoside phosphorylase
MMGISTMSITLMEMMYGFSQLKYIALIGIAAGSDSELQSLGDILIPTKVYNYESGKYIEKMSDGDPANNEIIFNSDYSSFDIDPSILQKISAVTSDETIIASIQDGWKEKKENSLKVHTGNFACGSAVIASKKKVEEIEKAISRKYIGMDMETFALASVNQLKYNAHPKMFIIKSVTDFADSAKSDSEHKYASYVAAALFIEVCSRVIVETKQIKEIELQSQKKITIQSAIYDWTNGQVDVSMQVEDLVKKGLDTIIVDPAVLGIPDPAWGFVKTLTVNCEVNGQKKLFVRNDGQKMEFI